MKYLKTFEDQHDPLYTEISEHQFHQMGAEVDFDRNLFIEVQSKLDISKYVVELCPITRGGVDKFLFISSKSYWEKQVSCLMIDDEWFQVRYFSNINDSHYKKFYKCDRSDGLLQLLKDLGFIDL